MIRNIALCLVCWWACGQSGQAHFIWLDVRHPADGPQQAAVYFSETPEPGEPHLIGKVAHTRSWLRQGSAQPQELKLLVCESPAMLSSACATTTPSSIEAFCDYGPYGHDAEKMLLQYYAKRLTGEWWSQDASAARAPQLVCDIVPSLAQGRLELLVLLKDQPAAQCEVEIVDPSGKLSNLKTDAAGRVAIGTVAPGRYAIRAAAIETERGGKRGDVAYSQTGHYSTLICELPGPVGPGADKRSALDVLRDARNARSMWADFPGFTAQMRITADGQEITGKVTIDGQGNVTHKLAESPLTDWVAEQLRSMVQHRMPDGEVTAPNVTFADSDLSHPLGRKIDLGDPDTRSAYRIKDDVILEVNRGMGDMHFTISVLDIYRNPEGKYLPTDFTMTFFDTASGQLRMTNAYRNAWQRVGRFDLPQKILEISTEKGRTVARQIVFEDCQLLK